MNSEFAWQCARRLQRSLCAIGGRISVPGILVGMMVVSWLHQYAATFGAERISRVVLLGAAGLGFLACPQLRRDRNRAQRHSLQTLLLLALAAWTVCFPWLLNLAAGCVGLVPAVSLARPAIQLAALAGAAAVLIGVPVTASLALLTEHGKARRAVGAAGVPRLGEELASVALGMLLLPLLVVTLAAWPALGLGLHRIAMTAALCGAVGYIVILAWQCRTLEECAGDVGAPGQEVAPARSRIDGVGSVSVRGTGPTWLAVLCAAACGVVIAGLSRAVHQLLPTSEWLVLVRWAVLIGAAGAAWQWSRGRTSAPDRSLVTWSMPLFLAIWPVAFFAVFPWFMDAVLQVNISVSQLGWLVLIQGGLVVVCFAPVGWMIGTISAEALPPAGGAVRNSTRTAVGAALIAGLLLGEGWLVVRYGPGALVLLVSLLCLVAALPAWKLAPAQARMRPSRLAGCAVAAVALMALASSGYDPAGCARILFSSRMFAAVRAGVSQELLPYVDESRCALLVEGDDGTISAWTYRGVQYHIRESGIPKAIVSTNADICPQFSTTVMQAAIPLVVHPHPRRVLLLGLGAGTALETCLAFPVQSVSCMEPERAMASFVAELADERAGNNPLADERVRLTHLPAPLAVLNPGEKFDVIISQADQPLLWKSNATLTREFYRRAAGCLSADGIFCQQFQFVDFGAQPLQVMAATWRSAFRHVAALETAPGEMILLGTNSKAGLAAEDLTKRMQAPHVRRTLAWMGWDWSMPLNLPAYGDDALGRIAEPVRQGGNTAAAGTLALTLPLEVLRWADKPGARRELLGPNTERLLDWTGEGDPDPEVLRRFAEIAAQQNLMLQYPDEYWMYRKAVREQIVERPRSLVQQIQQASFDRTLHPDDAQRLKYFKRLGEANQQKRPTVDVIEEVARFAEPYDPLISYFLHQEVAELYKRAGTQHAAEELSHRLYAVFHASPNDRSVRNISAAIKLVCQHPECIERPLRRWDVLSALQQMLLTRWEARGAVSPQSSRVVLNDIEISLEAIEASLPVMRQLTVEADLHDYDWNAREQVLQRTLIRPLHTYHGQLLPHHVRNRRKLAELKETDGPAATAERSDSYVE